MARSPSQGPRTASGLRPVPPPRDDQVRAGRGVDPPRSPSASLGRGGRALRVRSRCGSGPPSPRRGATRGAGALAAPRLGNRRCRSRHRADGARRWLGLAPSDRHDARRQRRRAPLYFKTTARDRYDAAKARFPHAPDVILWNERGEVTETTIGNLVLELDGEWLTPTTSSGLLPGTFRAELLEQETIRERVITLDELARARRIWMINSVRGWVPATLETAELLTASLDR
ncbi:MAG: aminotransferase class IV [Actinomycetota bacterium]